MDSQSAAYLLQSVIVLIDHSLRVADAAKWTISRYLYLFYLWIFVEQVICNIFNGCMLFFCSALLISNFSAFRIYFFFCFIIYMFLFCFISDQSISYRRNMIEYYRLWALNEQKRNEKKKWNRNKNHMHPFEIILFVGHINLILTLYCSTFLLQFWIIIYLWIHNNCFVF